MKILFITQFLPYPPDTGGKIKTWETLQILAKKHQVFLISFVDKKKDLIWEGEIKKICYGVKTFVAPIITTSHKQLKWKALMGVFNCKPFRVQKYFLNETADFISKLTKENRFDAVHCDHETSIQYLKYVSNRQNILKIYDEHNISSIGLWGYVEYEKKIIRKIAYFLEAMKFWLYEKKMMAVFDHILAISIIDKGRLIIKGKKQAGGVVFLPIPMKIKKLFKFGNKNIIFVGLMSWWPNNDAVLWFYRRIYPLIKRESPKVNFWVVGANPTQEVKDIGVTDSSVKVFGYVDSIEGLIKKSGVFIAPIRAGAGIRLKILKAFSFGLPTVTTKKGLEGIEVGDRRRFPVAEGEKEFSQMVINVIRKKNLAEKLVSDEIKFIKKIYNHRSAQNILMKIYS